MGKFKNGTDQPMYLTEAICRRVGTRIELFEGRSVIELTRLNNRPLVVNSDLIKFIENTPDTVMTLITGEKVIVSESCQEVIEKIVEFRRKTWVGLSYPTAASVRELEETTARSTDESIED